MREDIYEFVKQQGFRTLTEIQGQFPTADADLLAGHLDYLISKTSIRRIKFKSPDDKDLEMYYLPV